MSATITYWTYRQCLIRNCKLFKRLSFVKRIVSIKPDPATKPEGRLVKLEIK